MGLHDGHRRRLKEQFLAHGEDFHDHQLLELLLCYSIPQKDVNELAHCLLNEFGSLAGVLDAPPETLQRVPGVGEHSAVLLKLIPKLAGRYFADRSALGQILDSTQAARNFLRPYFLQAGRNEMIYLVCMDDKHKVLGCRKLAEGTVNTVAATNRTVAEAAINFNATAVILAHNHVSGFAFPSKSDLLTTKNLWSFLKAMDIELCDHLIFVDGDMVSMRDSSLFDGYDK